MAKKKRKFKTEYEKTWAKNADKMEQQVNEVAQEIQRATEDSFIFVEGNRVYIRNLSDMTLLHVSDDLQVKNYELHNELRVNENLAYQMNREKYYRKL